MPTNQQYFDQLNVFIADGNLTQITILLNNEFYLDGINQNYENNLAYNLLSSDKIDYPNKLDILTKLATKKINFDAPTNRHNGETILHYAVKNNDIPLVKILLLCGANLNVQSYHDKKTPLHWAAQQQFADIVYILLNAQANVNLQDSDGLSALHHIIISNKDIDIVNNIIQAGANLNLQDKVYKTPLMYATMLEKNDIAMILINRGANIDLTSIDGRNALHIAVYYQNFNMTRELLQLGISRNIVDKSGNTALDLAFQARNKPLITFGRDKQYQMTSGQHGMMMSVKSTNHEVNGEDTNAKIKRLLISYKCVAAAYLAFTDRQPFEPLKRKSLEPIKSHRDKILYQRESFSSSAKTV